MTLLRLRDEFGLEIAFDNRIGRYTLVSRGKL